MNSARQFGIRVFFGIYHLISFILRIGQVFPGACRYTPSCSVYAEEAFTHFGLTKGCIVSIRRFLRCRPGSAFGYDPVLKD